MEIIPNWHPIFVHFTVALLTISVALFAVSKIVTSWRLEDQWAAAAYWNLWIGTLLSIATVAAGWYAFGTVDHDDAALSAMVEHRAWALAAFGLFAVLAVWAVVQYNAEKKPSALFVVCGLVGLVLLFAAARHGGDLVYGHGLGVKALSTKGGHAQQGDQSKAAEGAESAHVDAVAPVVDVAPAVVAPATETVAPAAAEAVVPAPAAEPVAPASPAEPSSTSAVEVAPATSAEPPQSEVSATTPTTESAPAQ